MMPRFKRSFNAYLAGSGMVNRRDSVGTDMAIMSRCNFTVSSYGTFSFWSGFLSGGAKFLPTHYLGKTEWNGTQPLKFQHPFYLTDMGVPYGEPVSDEIMARQKIF